jgi:Tol biopolymer transport system component
MGPDPISAYNAAISRDGRRIAFESSRGNQNFAKRYGRIGVMLADRRRTRGVDRRSAGVPDSQSAYSPTISADGARVAYHAVRGGRTVILVADRHGRTRTAARGARVGGSRFADPYESSLSADGAKLVYTLAGGRLDDPAAARSQVLVRDLVSRTTTVASRAAGGAPARGFSADPAISPDGRYVAFTSDDPALGARRGHAGLFLRDLRAGRTRRIPTGAAQVLDPAVARAARVVAFTARTGARSRVLAWTRSTGAVTLVSRAETAADGASDDPSISADGRRIAFASTATNLDPGKADAARAIFVRDRLAGTTERISLSPGGLRGGGAAGGWPRSRSPPVEAWPNFSCRNRPWAISASASTRTTASKILSMVAPSRSSWSISSISEVLPFSIGRESAQRRGSRV